MNCHIFPALCNPILFSGLLRFRRTKKQLRELFFWIPMIMYDLINGRADWQFHMELLRQIHQCFNSIDALSQLVKGLASDEVLAKPAIVAMRREECRLLVTQMR